MKSDTRSATVARLGRVVGQLRGVVGMIEQDRYCIDVVTQLLAVRAALVRVEELILRDHVATCVDDAVKSGDQREQRRKIDELMRVLQLYRSKAS